MPRKVAVVAIGGNSLIKDKDHQSAPDQHRAACETMSQVADLVQHGWEMIITHGNGPQVGFLLRRSDLARAELPEEPLEVCGAQTQGAIGYMLQQCLQNEFARRGIRKQAVTVVTQVRVDADDPAFFHPTKPIGSFLDEVEALRRRDKEGWSVIEDAGRGWRRVVASPIPQELIELEAIRSLLATGHVVIAAGGGGIPVVRTDNGDLVGIPAVIDKDYASSLLARQVKADLFLISTAVETVFLDFGKPTQRPLEFMTVSQAQKYMEKGQFAEGSMAPKIRAMLWYLRAGGKTAIITNPDNIERALLGEAGTRIVPDAPERKRAAVLRQEAEV